MVWNIGNTLRNLASLISTKKEEKPPKAKASIVNIDEILEYNKKHPEDPFTFVKIYHCEESREKLVKIFEAVKEDKHIKNIHLILKSYSTKKFEELAHILSQNILPITSFSITGKLGEDLIEALKTNNSVLILDLAHSKIGNIAKILGETLKVNESIRKLDLGNSKLTPKQLELISEGLRENKSVYDLNINFLRMNKETDDIDDFPLSNNLNQSKFKLKNAKDEDEDGEEIDEENNFPLFADTSRPSSPNFNANYTPDNEIIAPKELKAIGGFLSGNQALTHIHLRSSNIKDGIVELAKGLESNTTLRYLDLKRSQQTIEGIKALSMALETNKTLHHLNLSVIHMPKGMEYLIKAIPKSSLMYLNLEGTFIEKNALMMAESLESNPNLFYLNISISCLDKSYAIPIFRALQTNTKLRSLSIEYIDSFVSFKFIIEAATKFLLNNNPYNSNDWESLTKAIKESIIKDILYSDDSSFSDNLTYSIDQISNAAAHALKTDKMLKNNFTQPLFEKYTDKDLSHPAHEAYLPITTELNLRKYRDALKTIYDEASYVAAQTLQASLIQNSHLTDLSLRSDYFAARDLELILNGLQHNKGIIYLNLAANPLGSEGARYLAKALKENTNISHLNINLCEIKDEGLSIIANALIGNKNISYIQMGSNNITDITPLIKIIKTTNITNCSFFLHELNNRDLAILTRNLEQNKARILKKVEFNNIAPEKQTQIFKEFILRYPSKVMNEIEKGVPLDIIYEKLIPYFNNHLYFEPQRIHWNDIDIRKINNLVFKQMGNLFEKISKQLSPWHTIQDESHRISEVNEEAPILLGEGDNIDISCC